MTTKTNPHPDVEEFLAQLNETLKSAVERGVIPDIARLPYFVHRLFFDSLNVVLPERLQNLGPSDDMQQRLVEEFNDEELRRAWHYVTLTIDKLRNGEATPDSPYEFAKQHVLQKNQEEYNRRMNEEGMWDAYVTLGRLPSQQQLASNPVLHGLFAEQQEKYIQRQEEVGEPLYLDGAVAAWDEAKQQYTQLLIETGKHAARFGTEPVKDESAVDAPESKGLDIPSSIVPAGLSGADKRSYDICIEAIRAKHDRGTTFEDFIAQHSGYEYPTTTRTLRRWIRRFGLKRK